MSKDKFTGVHAPNGLKDENDMEELTRFDPCIEREPYATQDYASMEVYKYGEWLKYSDVKELWNTRPKEEKGGAIAEALEMVENFMHLHKTNTRLFINHRVITKDVIKELEQIRSTLKGTE
jgi:hypothetical protein